MTKMPPATPLHIAGGVGELYWWTGELATIKVTAQHTGGRYSLVEIMAPTGLGIPRHVHDNEDEGFWILEGAVRFEVGDAVVTARPGDFVFAPRGVPHRYAIAAGPARLLFLFTPGGFEGFIRESGEAAAAPELPPAHVIPDMTRLTAAAAKYGCRILE